MQPTFSNIISRFLNFDLKISGKIREKHASQLKTEKKNSIFITTLEQKRSKRFQQVVIEKN
jgi:Tfp pilus assembly ATPase PilU